MLGCEQISKLLHMRVAALCKLSKLSDRDRWLLLQAFVAVANAWLMVRLLPGSAILEKIRKEIPLTRVRESPHRERIAWAVAVAAWCVPGSKCLVQAIAGRNLLASYGFPSEIHIGVAKNSKNWLSAHAWVQVEGRTLIGGDTAQYAPLVGSSVE